MSKSTDSIAQNRKKLHYRFLEAFLGILTISFLGSLFFLAFYSPNILAVFLILYSFLMVLKVGLHGVYTIYTYKNLRRWESVNWKEFLSEISKDPANAKGLIDKMVSKYGQKIDWKTKLEQDLKSFEEIQGSKFSKPDSMVHIPLFAVYNESFEVLKKSVEKIYNCGYDLSKIILTISQEARVGEDFNRKIRENFEKENWTNCYNISEKDLNLVYQDHENLENYENDIWDQVEFKKNKLNIIFTQHPDGLIGEIKGKASNEDWGGRQISLLLQSKKIDPEICLITSLDADSKVGENFFQMLSYRYCITPDRLQAGFQPLPIYTSNFFEVNLFPRLVATNTTIWHMILYSVLDDLHFFANYSVPVKVLRKSDFWVREVIAEDSMLFAKCLVAFDGNFRVVPFYGTFEGDAVYGDDYIEAIINQYRQLQRWAWGGIEGFPYKFQKFFIDKRGSKIDLRKRFKYIFQEVTNHFYWATLPLVFSIFVILPNIVGGNIYRESAISHNLWIFSQYFSWLSFLFLIISSYITLTYIGSKAKKHFKPKWYHWFFVILQWFIAPFIFIFWGPPAIDVQLKGIFGNYLGYWVTPKK
jgi:Glycosyl transferase family group 2